jgi:ketosteroid isomerase-like protein
MAQEKSAADGTAMKRADAMEKKIVDAFNKKDPAALANLYTDNAVFVGPDGKALMGHAAIQQDEADTIKAWGDFTFKGELKEAGAFGRGFWGLYEASVDGNGPHGPVKVRSHVLNLFVPVGKDWKIVVTSIGANVQPPGM